MFSWLGNVLPVAAQITPGITVGIKDVVQLPDTRTSTTEDGRVAPGFTRINFMKEVPDNSNRWFVNDLRGQIYVVDSATQTLLPNKYLDFSTSSQVNRFIIGSGGLSTGLINITPDPNFANNGKFYTIHEETSNGAPAADFQAQGNAGTLTNAQHTVISEWTATDPTANVFSGNLFATDIGQSRVEEVNIIDSGENYGWGRTNYEGNYTTSGTELTSAPAGFTFPVAQYLYSDLPGANEAIAGGFVPWVTCAGTRRKVYLWRFDQWTIALQ